MERSFEFTVISASDGTSQKKSIRQLRADELKDYKSLGSGTGSLMEAFARGSRHCKDFSARVVGFTVSEEGIGKTMGDALGAGHWLLEKQPELRLTYTFYEKV